MVRIKEYMHKRVADWWGGLEQGQRECLGRERWRLISLRGNTAYDDPDMKQALAT